MFDESQVVPETVHHRRRFVAGGNSRFEGDGRIHDGDHRVRRGRREGTIAGVSESHS